MYEDYMICEHGFRNVSQAGKIYGFELKVRIPYYRGLILSMLEDFIVSIDGELCPRESIRFSVRNYTFTLDELQQQTGLRWEFGVPATLTILKPGGLNPGEHDVHLTQRLRISYMPWPSVTVGSKRLLLEAASIKRGVSLYSYQQEFYLRKMNLEDCIAAVAAMGADGIEILGEQMIPGFPNPSDEFVDRWFGWMEKYKTTPTAYDAFLDTKLYKDRELTDKEAVEMMVRDIKLANRLGFKTLRVLVTVPRSIIEQTLPYAEQYDVALGIEIHSPWSLKSEWIDENVELIQRSGTRHFGFIPDMGIFVKKLPPVMQAWHVRHGATESIIHHIADAYENRQSLEKTKAEVVKLGGNEADLKFADISGHFRFDDPKWLTQHIPHMLHIHAKFYEMTDQLVEPSIPYDEIIKVLREGGYGGYLCSEYEGQRHIQDAFEVDSVEQVRRQHLMMQRLISQ